jgi:hypothetical protein
MPVAPAELRQVRGEGDVAEPVQGVLDLPVALDAGVEFVASGLARPRS